MWRSIKKVFLLLFFLASTWSEKQTEEKTKKLFSNVFLFLLPPRGCVSEKQFSWCWAGVDDEFSSRNETTSRIICFSSLMSCHDEAFQFIRARVGNKRRKSKMNCEMHDWSFQFSSWCNYLQFCVRYFSQVTNDPFLSSMWWRQEKHTWEQAREKLWSAKGNWNMNMLHLLGIVQWWCQSHFLKVSISS